MANDDLRQQRRAWLLRLCSQAMQQQQVGPSGAGVLPVHGTPAWPPAPGWAGQNAPPGNGFASVPGAEEEGT